MITLTKEHLLGLLTPDLDIYTCVVLARKTLETTGNIKTALSQLRVDADKLRMHSTVLYELIVDRPVITVSACVKYTPIHPDSPSGRELAEWYDTPGRYSGD